ncbi:TPA_asm: hypothetical protein PROPHIMCPROF_79 [Mycobacterium phage McProf]|uniref:DUF2746 domain-containing protein n=1 Tax=Mycobacteroides chelonae TaxID=1774 RepID=UPI000618D5DA|nr:DUF2746 domain-containing protein [Mycobacteroides chelonae]VEG15749.1 Bacteriophage protein [Mycolicibacterium phlei]DAZ90067.1 TPA_asm: hypothetical protein PROPHIMCPROF_79 [Mycobacterium phage McProf]AKC38450.1 hypothetical protein GR01_07550 [Mycobacteroides chelonae]ANA97693.1 hypothetical protein BB28_08010 [Mycobacteroides chelonae CCUG 47445]OLT75193.1 hypothetical protein BKG56_15600 [Mycobacteroides chelonae]
MNWSGIGADNLMDLVAYGIIGIAYVLSQRQTRNQLEAIRGQVQNGHKTPMRTDLDEVKDDVRGIRKDFGDFRSEVRTGFRNLREDLNAERDERIASDQELAKRHRHDR